MDFWSFFPFNKKRSIASVSEDSVIPFQTRIRGRGIFPFRKRNTTLGKGMLDPDEILAEIGRAHV